MRTNDFIWLGPGTALLGDEAANLARSNLLAAADHRFSIDRGGDFLWCTIKRIEERTGAQVFPRVLPQRCRKTIALGCRYTLDVVCRSECREMAVNSAAFAP